MFNDPIIEKMDTVDRYKLLHSLGVPIILNLTSNSMALNFIAIRAFMCHLHEVGLLSLNYYDNTELVLKYKPNGLINGAIHYQCKQIFTFKKSEYFVNIGKLGHEIHNINKGVVFSTSTPLRLKKHYFSNSIKEE